MPNEPASMSIPAIPPMPAVTAPVTAPAAAPAAIENSTDASRGQPLAKRAQLRRAELEDLRAKLPEDAQRERGDLDLAISMIDSLLTGDTANLPDVTARDVDRWLENSKHLGEAPPAVAAPAVH